MTTHTLDSDVFHHPYTYAAWHRIPTGPTVPAPAVA